MTTSSPLRWLGPLAIASLVAWIGWSATWFLCDDAFIAFRYVGHAHDGHGLVWNAAPWQPVEGYSSFLWVAILLLTWNTTGIQPPESANVLSLLCAIVTLTLVSRRIDSLRLPPALAPSRAVLATIVLVATAANPTWITWQSSGLDAALFGMIAVGWTLSATAANDARGTRHLSVLAAWAALGQLARPDGALLILATLAIAIHAAIARRAGRRSCLLSLWPMLAPAAHLAWRRTYYGEWLPNTYFAKVGGAWPESGLRYLYCFAFEHGVWPWLALALAWVLRGLRHRARLRQVVFAPASIAFAACFGHVGFYSIEVGGDHFGYRPFMHLVPLLFVSSLVMLRDLGANARWATCALATLAMLGSSFGWWHERLLLGREVDGFVRVARHVPACVRPIFRGYDRCQAWLRVHLVGIRRLQHKALCDDLQQRFPPRGTPIENWPAGRRGVLEVGAAGVAGWRLPQCDVIDVFGLNDWVVARNPATRHFDRLPAATIAEILAACDKDHDQRLAGTELETLAPFGNRIWHSLSPEAWTELLEAGWGTTGAGLTLQQFEQAVWELTDARRMAHERQPPRGYTEALRPCVVLVDGRFVLQDGVRPITDAEIVAVETQYRSMVAR